MKQNNINLVYNEEYFKNKKKVKLKKIKKIIISIGLAGSILVGGFAGFVAKSTYDYHNADTSSSSVVYVDKDANINNIDSGYISVDTSNEKEAKGILFNSKINIKCGECGHIIKIPYLKEKKSKINYDFPSSALLHLPPAQPFSVA